MPLISVISPQQDIATLLRQLVMRITQEYMAEFQPNGFAANAGQLLSNWVFDDPRLCNVNPPFGFVKYSGTAQPRPQKFGAVQQHINVARFQFGAVVPTETQGKSFGQTAKMVQPRYEELLNAVMSLVQNWTTSNTFAAYDAFTLGGATIPANGQISLGAFGIQDIAVTGNTSFGADDGSKRIQCMAAVTYISDFYQKNIFNFA